MCQTESLITTGGDSLAQIVPWSKLLLQECNQLILALFILL